jgi:hypothetical protein
MTQADKIRQFALDHYVVLARARGRAVITIRAGDIHREMNLANAMPAVCSAIGSNKFEQIAQVRSINRTGPANGANVYFEFGLAADPLPIQAVALRRRRRCRLQRLPGQRRISISPTPLFSSLASRANELARPRHGPFIRPRGFAKCAIWWRRAAEGGSSSPPPTASSPQMLKSRPTNTRSTLSGSLDSGAKRNVLKRSGFECPFQARQSRLGMAS